MKFKNGLQIQDGGKTVCAIDKFESEQNIDV
jgi:hypothetical protein